MKFTWHPAREPATAQDLLIEFVPEDGGVKQKLSGGVQAEIARARGELPRA